MSYAYYEDYRSTSGINAVYVVYGTADKAIKYESRSNNPIVWYTYEDVLTPLQSEQVGRSSTIPLTHSECGYVVMDDDGDRYRMIKTI